MQQPVDILASLEGVTAHWLPNVVGRVNDQDVKVAKLLGQLCWHRHDNEDELFQVVRGRSRGPATDFRGRRPSACRRSICGVLRLVLRRRVQCGGGAALWLVDASAPRRALRA